MMYLFIKKHWVGIVIAIVIIALLFLGNIDAIKAIVDSWTPSIVVAVLSVFVAACALVAIIWQGWETRNNNRLSLRPWLKHVPGLHTKRSGLCYSQFEIINKGVGPAIIKDVMLLFDDKIKAHNSNNDWHYFFTEEVTNHGSVKLKFLTPDDIMQVGEGKILWVIESTNENEAFIFYSKLELLIKYQSIYEGKTFTYSYKDSCTAMGNNHAPPPIALIAQEMELIHADCFTIPRPWTEKEFTDLLRSPHVFYTEHEHGFALGRRLDDTETELLTLAIVPEQQGKGFGRELLNNFIIEVKNNGGQNILLEVAKNNTPALHLYEKAGFYEIGNRPAYYQVPNAPNIDAILMRMDINNT